MRWLKKIMNGVPFLAGERAGQHLDPSPDLSKSPEPEEIFTEIYRNNTWAGSDSVSGPGSDLTQTRVIAREIPVMLRELGIRTMLDVPCGDFHWMRKVDLGDVNYTGADIVEELISSNSRRYQRARVQFLKLDLTRDPLPKSDLVFCRDCLVHLSSHDIFLALKNICASESRYLLTTTFAAQPANPEIATGHWRPVNLEVAPFVLPRPLRLVNEGCTELGGIYADKSLGLWSVAEIAQTLTSSARARHGNSPSA